MYVWAEGVDLVSFGTGEYSNLALAKASIILYSEAREAMLDIDPAMGSIPEPLIQVIEYSFSSSLLVSFNINLAGRVSWFFQP